MNPKVVVVKGNKLYEITKKALNQFDFQEVRGKKILIKPNAARVANPGDGIIMKTHMHTKVTLGIKNMKGLLWRKEKVRFHQLQSNTMEAHEFKPLDLAISDMATIL